LGRGGVSAEATEIDGRVEQNAAGECQRLMLGDGVEGRKGGQEGDADGGS